MKSKYSNLYNNLHFVFFAVILFILSLKYWYIFIVLGLYLLFLFRKTEVFILTLCILLLVLVGEFKYIKRDIPNEVNGIIIESSNNNNYILLTKYGKIYLYSKKSLSLGDYGVFIIKEDSYYNAQFDEYLTNKGILYKGVSKSSDIKDNYFVLSKIQAFFENRLGSDIASNYVKTLILGSNNIEADIKNKTQHLGISHILSISGLHVSILLALISFFLDKLFYFSKPKDIIKIIFLILLILVTNFQISVIRSAVMMILTIYFARKKYLFTKLDSLSIIGIIILVLSPRTLFLMSFELSFLSSFILITLVSTYDSSDKILYSLKLSTTLFLTSLPIILRANYEVNLLTIILSPIYSLVFEVILIPISVLLFIFPSISPIFNVLFEVFEKSITVISKIKDFTLIFGDISFIELVIYYVFLFFLFINLNNKGRRTFGIVFLSIYLIIIYARPFLSPFFKIVTYDVGQGDSILISLPHNSCNILVDCYGDILDNLKRDGIKKIDTIILTHGDSDHISSFEDVYSSYYPSSLITSKYTTSEELNRLLGTYDFNRYSSGATFKIKGLEFTVYGPISYSDFENNNSLVFQFKYGNYTYLFTGDAEEKEEYDIVNAYRDKLKSDVLKAAHHGSITSSTELFLSYVKPDIVLISVGKNNKYGLPNNYNLLNNYTIYRTDLEGSIYLYDRFNKLLIKNN